METFRGAEAVVEIGEKVSKSRVPKSYRHPDLDERLNRDRTENEAKLMREARRAGAKVPGIESVEENTILMEKIPGKPLKEEIEKDPGMCEKLGLQVARLHAENIIHGDLTTSNVVVSDGELYIVDFGLSNRSERTEDRAVDIHLFRQVLSTSHSGIEDEAWQSFLEGYNRLETSEEVLKRLEKVEKRGRFK